MRLLFAIRGAILGGVCSQLANRMRFLSTVPNLEVEFLIEEDRGARELLAKHGEVSIADPWRFRELVASRRFDAIVAIDAGPYLDAIAELSGEHCLVVEIHATDPEELAYLRERKFSCDTFVVPSRHSKRMLQELGLMSPYDPIEVAPNIVDARLFYPSPGEPNARPIVGWVGKLDEQKDWKPFLLTASLLAEGGRDLDFWMAGGEHARDAVVEAFLESIDALDLSERLRWFPRLEYAAMRRFYAAIAASGGCMLATAPSTSIAEALLTGCPVVAPDRGAVGEVAPGASYLPLYREIEQAAQLVESFVVGDSRGVRAKLEADLPTLRQRSAPETLGPTYLAMIARLLERRRNG